MKNLCAIINQLAVYDGSKIIFIATDAVDHSMGKFSASLLKGLQNDKKVFFAKIPMLAKIAIKKLKPKVYQQLFEDLIFDGSNTRKELNYKEPYTFENAIKETSQLYLSHKE